MFPGGCQAACLRNGWGSEKIFRSGSRLAVDYYKFLRTDHPRNFWAVWRHDHFGRYVWGAADIRDCNQTLFIPHHWDSSASSYSPHRISFVLTYIRALKSLQRIFYTYKTCVNCNYFLAFS